MCIHGLSLFLDDCKIFLCSLCAMGIALLKACSLEVLWENFLLKYFRDSKFSSSFHFKPFEFFYLVVKIKNHISFLQHLSVVLLDIKLSSLLFLFCSWNHHGFVGPIDFEKDCHFFSSAVLPLLPVFKPLVLIIRVLFVDEMVEYIARVRQLKASARFEVDLDILGKACR